MSRNRPIIKFIVGRSRKYSLGALAWLLITGCSLRGPEKFSQDHLMRGLSWPNPPQEMATEEVQRLLNQPFVYLGYGTQAAAFVGEDGTTVLKLLLRKSLKGEKKISFPSLRRLLFPVDKEAIKRQRCLDVLRRYAAAYEDLREETALLYTHLNPSEGDFSSVRVRGVEGEWHEISLVEFPFIVQRKVETMGERYARGEGESACGAVWDLLQKRARKGYHDRRKHDEFLLFFNYGFLGDKAVMLDPGNLEYSAQQKKDPGGEIVSLERRLGNWKKKYCPGV